MEKNREIKFSYILQHEETGMIHEQIFDYLAIFSGACRDRILRMNRHIVVAKRQYTGLHDKNGKEIYEGDICKINFHEEENPFDMDSDYIERNGTCKISYNLSCAGFDVERISGTWPGHYLGFETKDDFEVIGNIYNNPELLTTPPTNNI